MIKVRFKKKKKKYSLERNIHRFVESVDNSGWKCEKNFHRLPLDFVKFILTFSPFLFILPRAYRIDNSCEEFSRDSKTGIKGNSLHYTFRIVLESREDKDKEGKRIYI